MPARYPTAVVLASCAALLAAGGTESAITRESVESRGERRTYYLLESAGRDPAPLVLLLHGTGGTGREQLGRPRAAREKRVALLWPMSPPNGFE